jgi:precorrin-2 dehydrogenase/sirohydrochlorin ferrochelatase
MDSFPAFFPLAGARIVLAGAGPGLEAKTRLLETSPAALERVDGPAALEPETYRGARLAFIAGEDEAFARAAAAAARAGKALVNVIDRPALSDFNTPAVIDRGEVVAAVGTGGAAPVLATLLRTELEARVPEGTGRFAALLRRMQGEVRDALPDLAQRRAFLRAAMTGPAAQAALAGEVDRAEALLREALAAPAPARGKVWFVPGAGPADLLSLRAVRALAAAEALAADAGVDPAVMELARRDAERLPIDALAAQAVAIALSGRAVARITAGPPDGGEILALRQLGVAVEVLRAAPAET